jgi:hypothetical protein
MGNVLGAPKGADGYLILEQLAHEGWSIAFVAAGDRIRAIATRGPVSAEAVGASVSHLAPFLVARARQAARAA